MAFTGLFVVRSLDSGLAPRRIPGRILELRVVPFGTVLDFRTTTSQNCEAIPRRARI